MAHPRRHAAALLAVLALCVPAPALADQPRLLAQMEEAQPDQPPLTADPPEPLRGDDDDTGGGDDGGGERARPSPLPATGAEAGILALLGLGLIASGGGLRLTLGRDGR